MKLLLNITLLLLVQIVFGQQVQHISKSNSSLIDDNLVSIAIDKKGNKWIGTAKFGLIQYDGKSFKNFNRKNSKINGDYITPIFVDTKGNTWVSFCNPNDGIARFDGKKWTVFTSKDLPKEVSIITIKEDKNGILYFGGVGGVLTFDGKKWTTLKLPKGKYTIRAMDINAKGDIAIGHNDGLLVKQKGKWKSFREDNSELRLDVVRAVKFTVSGELFIGYGGGFGDGGLSILKENRWKHYNKDNSSITDHTVRDIEIDSNGTMWMATNNGLIQFKNGEITPIFFREGRYKNTIMDITIEGKTLWIATNFGIIKMN